MATRFLLNDALWSELQSRVRDAGHVRAAVAYLGTGGSRLLPLRARDLLLVEMSIRLCTSRYDKSPASGSSYRRCAWPDRLMSRPSFHCDALAEGPKRIALEDSRYTTTTVLSG
jgi:hypothetical protein